MARLHWIALPEGLESVSNLGIVIASGVMFGGEFVADKIPGFDLIWNALHTFVRIPVAALMAYALGEHLSPEMHVLVTCLGALIAGIAHGSKMAARIAVTPSPEPVSNIGLSSGRGWGNDRADLAGNASSGGGRGEHAGFVRGMPGWVWAAWRVVRTGWRRVRGTESDAELEVPARLGLARRRG